MPEMKRLDERLEAAACMALSVLADKESPCAADIGCDHGYLTAHLLRRCETLSVLACDVSAPSLQKAKRLLDTQGLAKRAQFTVCDGLSAITEPVDVILICGMGAQTILHILREGIEKIGGAAVIVQSNVDLPVLRRGMAELGLRIAQEAYSTAAGRQYVTMLARCGEVAALSEREALLGTAKDGAATPEQRSYFGWQANVRRREMEQAAKHLTERTRGRMAENSRELAWIREAMSMNNCTVKDMEALVNGIAPFELAEEWDNVGLLFGWQNAEVTRALVALDLTEGVLREAEALGCQLIVTHHPLMFRPIKRLTDSEREGRLMLEMARRGMSLIAAHTCLDAAPGGVNDTLMAAMGAKNVRGEGCVRVGEVAEGMTFGDLVSMAERRLHAAVRWYGDKKMPVHVLGCCSGSGGSEIGEAKVMGADCFITGEVRHNEALDWVDAGVCIIEAGHYETENPVCEVLRGALQNAADALQYNVTVFCSKVDPFGR